MSVCAAPTCSHQSFDGSSYYVDVDTYFTVTSTVDNSSVLVENGLLRAQRLVQIHFCSQ